MGQRVDVVVPRYLHEVILVSSTAPGAGRCAVVPGRPAAATRD